MLILDLWGISFHAVIVFGLGKNFLFKSALGHCVNIKQNTNVQLILKGVEERRNNERFHLFDNGDLTFSKCDLKWHMPAAPLFLVNLVNELGNKRTW